MKKIFLINPILWWALTCQATLNGPEEVVFQAEDKAKAEAVFSQFSGRHAGEPGQLVLEIGRFFLETPYVANTLETGGKEKMVINLREMDCTTFAENCLAFAQSLRKKNPSFADFVAQLEKIRYRNGRRNGYPSRLHYFSDWIYDNDIKKTVRNVTRKLGGLLVTRQINFMTRHPGSYETLKNNPDLATEMAIHEAALTNRLNWYIPENKVAEREQQLMDGDIIGITTDIEGLDILHVVIICRIDGGVRFIHASSSEKKVVVSGTTLAEYLAGSKRATGIMVARPL